MEKDKAKDEVDEAAPRQLEITPKGEEYIC
jgi:hypothetical protein